MRISRRHFLSTAAAGLATPALIGTAFAAEGGNMLPIPDLLDLRGGTKATLDAQPGQTAILSGRNSATAGYNQGFLGPVIRMNRGETARLTLGNRLNEPISVHWHGMHIEGAQDGGPHTLVNPNEPFEAILDVEQPAATLWYHSHVHMRTGAHVWYGLAGMVMIDDPDAPDDGLPSAYGVDDLPLVVQDRVFDRAGQLLYAPQGPTRMMGYRGDQILVNGAIRPKADVPAGLVRLRILNGSNARIFHFRFSDERGFHQIATDGGFLPAPVSMNNLTLAPGERAEILVDFSDGMAVQLFSAPDTNSMMGGMMGGMMGASMATPETVADGGMFEVMRFAVTPARPETKTALPVRISAATLPVIYEYADLPRRRFSLDMMPSGGGMMPRMRGGGHAMAINGKSMDMAVINEQFRTGQPEIWEVSTTEMAHPFHIHGTSFEVLSNSDSATGFERTGWKDVVLISGTAELLVQFTRTADSDTPYMYHCHILEHEDLGMMGQFTVA